MTLTIPKELEPFCVSGEYRGSPDAYRAYDLCVSPHNLAELARMAVYKEILVVVGDGEFDFENPVANGPRLVVNPSYSGPLQRMCGLQSPRSDSRYLERLHRAQEQLQALVQTHEFHQPTYARLSDRRDVLIEITGGTFPMYNFSRESAEGDENRVAFCKHAPAKAQEELRKVYGLPDLIVQFAEGMEGINPHFELSRPPVLR